MTINVTERDIKLGVPASNEACPIARAIRRRVKSGTYVRVAYGHIRFSTAPECDGSNDDDEIVFADTVDRFARAFDKGRKVMPRTFDIDIPEQFLRRRVAP